MFKAVVFGEHVVLIGTCSYTRCIRVLRGYKGGTHCELN